MSDLKQTMQRAREFIAANLAECCRDELDWQNTALLRDGKLREASAIYGKVDKTHAIPLAQAEVARQAMQFACRTQPEATAPAAVYQPVAWAKRSIITGEINGVSLTKNTELKSQTLEPLYLAAPAQDLSAAILAMDCPDTSHYGVSKAVGYEQAWDECRRAAAALASSANALSAGDSQKALDALLTRIDDAFEAYERYGAICEFEGNPMIYADTLTEIVTLRGEYQAILQSQKAK